MSAEPKECISDTQLETKRRHTKLVIHFDDIQRGLEPREAKADERAVDKPSRMLSNSARSSQKSSTRQAPSKAPPRSARKSAPRSSSPRPGRQAPREQRVCATHTSAEATPNAVLKGSRESGGDEPAPQERNGEQPRRLALASIEKPQYRERDERERLERMRATDHTNETRRHGW